MMFVYYGYLLPLSTRIRAACIEDGIWTDSGFMRYTRSAASPGRATTRWCMASRAEDAGAPPRVPGVHLGEVRHFLRDKIGEHAIEFDAGPGLHLGTRDTRESV